MSSLIICLFLPVTLFSTHLHILDPTTDTQIFTSPGKRPRCPSSPLITSSSIPTGMALCTLSIPLTVLSSHSLLPSPQLHHKHTPSSHHTHTHTHTHTHKHTHITFTTKRNNRFFTFFTQYVMGILYLYIGICHLFMAAELIPF